jgi:L-seryl-tRNA(Ser) seleniumtransferase
MSTDRFGNPLAAGLPYARGTIVRGTEDDFAKLQHAWQFIKRRVHKDGVEAVFNLTGLERSLRLDPSELPFADDEIAPAMYWDRLRELALDHLGGTPDRHDVVVFNRMTGATLATHLVLLKPGDTVVGVSVGYSHPSVTRAAAAAGTRFIDTVGADAFVKVLEAEPKIDLVDLTRLAVTYEVLPADTLTRIIGLAHAKGALVYADDAGGARVGPAIFDQPRLLQIGVDVVATGLDKYGTSGPRLGLLAGRTDLVAKIRARAFEYGLEARPMLYPAVVRSLEHYSPERVRTLVESTTKVAIALKRRLGSRVRETPVTAQLLGEDILEIAMERAGLKQTHLVPIEATAGLAMLLLQDYGAITVHFAGMPPGTSAILFKFMPPETLARFGGADKFAEAVDLSLSRLSTLIGRPEDLHGLLFGGAKLEVPA